MKTIVLKDGYGIDRLRLIDAPRPQIGRDEILVNMKAASLNYVDLLLVKGELNPDITPPFTPLSDGAGVVEEVGMDVQAFMRATVSSQRIYRSGSTGVIPGKIPNSKPDRVPEHRRDNSLNTRHLPGTS